MLLHNIDQGSLRQYQVKAGSQYTLRSEATLEYYFLVERLPVLRPSTDLYLIELNYASVACFVNPP